MNKMRNAGNTSFNMRAFLVLTATATGILLPITGFGSHFTQMEPILSFSRHAWMSAHTLLGLVFMASTVSHVILNRRALSHYIRSCAVRAGVRMEIGCTVALVMILLIVAVGHAYR
jgi:hypothetical protein